MKKLFKVGMFMVLLFSAVASKAQFNISNATAAEMAQGNECFKKTKGAAIVVFGENPIEYVWCNRPEITQALKNCGFTGADPCKVLQELSYTDQVKVFKNFLYGSYYSSSIRQKIIDNAYMEVFGRVSTTAEFAVWDQKLTTEKKDSYATIITKSISVLNDNSENRLKVIQQMYMDVFGRMPTADDAKYWLASKDHYRLMYKAGINFLYQPNNLTELVATVERAYKKKKPSHTDAEVKQSLTAAKKDKRPFTSIIYYIK